jgi:hypothetical protein
MYGNNNVENSKMNVPESKYRPEKIAPEKLSP